MPDPSLEPTRIVVNTVPLVVDVPQAPCSGNYKAFEVERAIERIHRVSGRARSRRPVIVIQHESLAGPLDEGTDGWKLAEGLDVEPTLFGSTMRGHQGMHNERQLSPA